MKTSEVFKHALEFLWEGIEPNDNKRTYICFCLEEVNKDYFFDVNKHLVIIDNLLEGRGCLENWLLLEYGIFKGHKKKDAIKMQKTRKQWLEHLIKHYESIGD